MKREMIEVKFLLNTSVGANALQVIPSPLFYAKVPNQNLNYS